MDNCKLIFKQIGDYLVDNDLINKWFIERNRDICGNGYSTFEFENTRIEFRPINIYKIGKEHYGYELLENISINYDFSLTVNRHTKLEYIAPQKQRNYVPTLDEIMKTKFRDE